MTKEQNFDNMVRLMRDFIKQAPGFSGDLELALELGRATHKVALDLDITIVTTTISTTQIERR